jgi:hypothetical protein
MDEEDGRLGPPPGHIIGKAPTRLLLMHVTGGRAQQTGRADVLWDALAMSLCHPYLTHFSPSSPSQFLHPFCPAIPRISSIRIKEKCYENVPGK